MFQLILKDEKILILKRKLDDFLGGYWEIPGGKVEKNETFVSAVERELKEETGLVATSIRKTVGSFKYYSKGQLTQQINYVAAIENSDNNLTLLEHDDCAWIGMDEIQNYNFTDEMLICVKKILLKEVDNL